MSVKLEFQGLAAFKDQLRQLPAHLKAEGGAIVQAHAEEAQRLVQDGYPEGPTGNLKRRVYTKVRYTNFGADAEVQAKAPHAWIFENGTKVRQTKRGANRGAMPKADAAERAIPKFIRVRARMTKALIDLIRRAGFEVDERA